MSSVKLKFECNLEELFFVVYGCFIFYSRLFNLDFSVMKIKMWL